MKIKKGNNKRSQITIFIIMGIIILIFVAFLMFIVSQTKTNTNKKSNTNNINSFVESCIEASANDGLYIIGRQGGYIKLPAMYYSTKYGNIAYGFMKYKNTLRNITDIKKEYEKYIAEETLLCVNNFKEFKERGYNISYEKPEVSVDFAARTIVSVKFNIVYKKGGSSNTLSLFKIVVPVRFSHIYELANKLSNKMEEFPGYVDLSILGDNDVDAYIIPYIDDKVTMIILEDKKSRIYEMPYKFLFATK